MINDPRLLYRRFATCVAGLTVLATLLRTLSLTLFFDRSVGYVGTGFISTLLYMAYIAMILCFLLNCAVYFVMAQRLEKTLRIAVAPDETATTPLVRYASWACAAIFVGAMAVEVLLYGLTGMFPLPRCIAAIVSALYFALPRSQKTVLTGFGVLGYGIFTIAYEYFDWTVALNSPIKLMQEAALASAMLFVLAELNHINHTRRSIRYTVCAALSLLCGAVNGISLIAAALVGDVVKGDYLIHALPPLFIALYAAARLFAPHEIELPEPVEESPEAPDAEQAPQASDAEAPDSQDAPQPTSQEEES
jgi:hypothetical protein